ncbi:radical SAM protein [Tissierella sp. MB52-C2]|uniref:radical SAM/SPASM domain-containing protein n=1 Tax=Tissierella sp. MB52-C2 TaxID=3070999 RepID=UPI00280BE4E5|nr:radical SAM protein [Tissierella sp. MB52-C2]WMM24649.1 radical SAM protein [Tissierella sp. MB52-C2]
MIGKFNIRTDNEKTVHYNYGKYIIFDLVTLDYIVTDKEEYNELLDDYRDYLKNNSDILIDEAEIIVKDKKQFLDLVFITGFDCNYNCIYCYQKDYKHIKSKMNTDDLDKIKKFYKVYDELFDTNSIIKTITIMGGEPFLDDNFKFIESVFEKFPTARLTFTTNGSNISKYESLIKSNRERIQTVILSIDGNKKLHLKHRNTFNDKFYDNIWEALEFLLNNDIEIIINSVYHPEEIEDYPLFFDILEKHGWLENKFSVKFDLDMMKTKSIGGDKTYINIAKESFKQLIELDNRAKYLSQSFTNYTEISMLSMIQSRETRIPYKHCDLTFRPSYTFIPNGKAVTCLSSDNPKLEVGTYKPEILINKDNIENIHNRDVRNMSRCKDCDYKYFCRGGCIAENIKRYDTLDIGYCSRWKEEDYKVALERVLNQLIAEEIRNTDKIKA